MNLMALVDEIDGEIDDVESLLERTRDALVWAADEIAQLRDDLMEYEVSERMAEQRLDYQLATR